jgi:predicted RNA-binding Zn-ribbon protein involved in translation (DUF1610 family)
MVEHNRPAVRTRLVSRYLDFPEGTYTSTALYSYEEYCGACERLLEGAYDDWYCRFCGVPIVHATFADLEGKRDGAGPWKAHPLQQKEAERKAQKEADRRAHDPLFCSACQQPFRFYRTHKRTTKAERAWDVSPVGEHRHYRCPGCGADQISIPIRKSGQVLWRAKPRRAGGLALSGGKRGDEDDN